MTLFLISIAAIIFGLLLVFSLIRSYLLQSQLKKSLSDAETELYKEKEKSQALATELSLVKEKFAHDVLYDALTSLPGRRVFEDRLNQIINNSKRYQLLFGVMFLDVDSFKVVNDALGHDVGDELLKEVAIRLQNAIRTVDTVSRFSGDEFVFILTQLSKPETAAFVAQRLLSVIAQPFRIHGQELFITASIGIATYPIDGDDPKMLLKNAYNALHQAKARQRNKYQFYRADMHSLSQRELLLNSSLQNPTIYQEFVIRYQPEINLELKKVVSMQALLSWQHPDYGLIYLNEFLYLAENNNKIIEIGDWLLKNALQQILKWQSAGYATAVTVTVSARQIENPRFAYKLQQLLQEMNIDPVYLILELSEKALTQKLDLIEKVFHMLKHLGVQIAIKDFGTGHLALQHLKDLPIDYLKISSMLVQNVTVNKENESFVKMIVMLATSLQITVTAEGVETQKQKQALLAEGCKVMQGDLFSAPLLAEEVTQEKMNSFVAE